VAQAVSEQRLARPKPEPNVPRHRFGIAYLVLAAIVGAAVGLLIVLAAGGARHSVAWSAWKPSDSGVRRLNQISKFVESEYALPSGRRLVLVLSTPPEVQSQGQPVALRAIGVSTGLPGETAADASFYDASTAWAYDLCGLGTNCAVSEGRPSVARFDLLRREALELALYTFKYESSVDTVLAFLPPTVSPVSNTAVFFRRQDLAQALKEPLARTLKPPKTSLRPGQMSAGDLQSVDQYTSARVYQYQFKQLQDGTPVLVLVPLKA
jgi:hypothetical protein